MKFFICTGPNLGRELSIHTASNAKKDSISSFHPSDIFFVFLSSGKLMLFYKSKKYFGYLIGFKSNIALLMKSEHFLKRTNFLMSYIFIFEHLSTKICTNRTKVMTHKNIEKSITYLFDRKKKLVL